MHEHVLIFIKLDSDKEQDSQDNLHHDPASLGTLLSLFCMIPTRHGSKHFSMAIRNVATRMFAWWATFNNNNALQEWMHYVLWSNKHNPPQQFSLDSKWRIIGHCDAYHTVLTSAMHVIQKLYRAKPWLIALVQVAFICANKSRFAGTCMFMWVSWWWSFTHAN